MNYVIFVLGTVIAGVGIYVGQKLCRKSTKIEFKISVLNIIFLAFSMFALISVVMAVEMFTNHLILLNWNPQYWGLKIVKELINSGIIVAVLLPLLSLLFGKWIQDFDMDLCSIYSENVIKIYYSLVVALNCILYLFIISPDIMNDSVEIRNIFNRVVIWALNILGTWIGAGFHCKGRIAVEIENINKSKEIIEKKELIQYIFSFGGVFVFNLLVFCVLYFAPELYSKWFRLFYEMIIIFIVCMFITALIGLNIKFPSKRKSNRELSKMVKKMEKLDFVKAKYHRLEYSLVRGEKGNIIKIQKQEVDWTGHEQEVQNVFGERDIPVDEFEYRECQEKLSDVLEKQFDLLRKGYKDCKDERAKELIDKKIGKK